MFYAYTNIFNFSVTLNLLLIKNSHDLLLPQTCYDGKFSYACICSLHIYLMISKGFIALRTFFGCLENTYESDIIRNISYWDQYSHCVIILYIGLDFTI